MPTLHIEHSIVDFDLWNAAFGRFAEARRQAGVRDHRIQRPVDDANCVVIDLDFDTTPTKPENSWSSSATRSGRPQRMHPH